MRPVIAMQTDFGVGGGSAMRGTCLKVDPDLEVYEISHSIGKFDIRYAAESLRSIVPFWPEGTVFVSVVDPGVGTSRRASVAELCNGSYVVTPDNGTLTLLLDTPGIRAIRTIDERVNRLRGTEKVSIFHGRDLFAYCAAKLASGLIDFEGVGPEYPVDEIVRFPAVQYNFRDGYAESTVTGAMRTFGNIETGIPIAAAARAGIIPGGTFRFRIIREDGSAAFDGAVPYRSSFGWVPEGSEVMYNNSSGHIGIGVNLGDFSNKYGVSGSCGWKVIIEREQ